MATISPTIWLEKTVPDSDSRGAGPHCVTMPCARYSGRCLIDSPLAQSAYGAVEKEAHHNLDPPSGRLRYCILGVAASFRRIFDVAGCFISSKRRQCIDHVRQTAEFEFTRLSVESRFAHSACAHMIVPYRTENQGRRMSRFVVI